MVARLVEEAKLKEIARRKELKEKEKAKMKLNEKTVTFCFDESFPSMKPEISDERIFEGLDEMLEDCYLDTKEF